MKNVIYSKFVRNASDVIKICKEKSILSFLQGMKMPFVVWELSFYFFFKNR